MRKPYEEHFSDRRNRHNLGEKLEEYHFDVVLDVTAYTGSDIVSLYDALGDFEEYILISSSAVYPESNVQPFAEERDVGVNKLWGKYGTDKIDAEWELRKCVLGAYILRPPYLYEPQNNVYREGFVFDCAMAKQDFYLPKDGEIKTFNVGNASRVSVREWVQMCYEIVGSDCKCIPVHEAIEQREYFCFHDYEYFLDVSKQTELMPETKTLREGLRESYEWYRANQELVRKRPYYINGRTILPDS